MTSRPGNKRPRLLWLGLALSASLHFLAVASGQSLQLQLRNGDRLSGRWISEAAGQLTISNAIVGQVSIPLAEIERRTTNQTALAAQARTNAVPTNNVATASVEKRLAELQAAYFANLLSPEDYHRQRAKLLADARAAAKPPTPPADMVAEGVPAPALVNPAVVAKPAPASSTPGAPKPKPPPKYWSGEALLGADMAFSEKDRQLYTGRLKFLYAKKALRSDFDYLATYGRTDGELSANRMDSRIKADYDINPKTYFYALGGGGYDEIRKIDWRYEVGPGIGRHLYRLTNFVLNAEAGLNYQVQNFEGNRQDDLFHYRLAQDLKWNIGTQFTFDERVEYLPQWNHPEEFKLRAEANLRYWVRANLSLNLTVINIFDTLTAPGVTHNDLQIRSSIGVKF